MKKIIHSLEVAGLIGGLFWLGVLLHETGHIVTAWSFGAQLTHLNVLGLDLLPSLRWAPRPGYYGYMTYAGYLSPSEHAIFNLAGSLVTFTTAVVAQLALWMTCPRRGSPRWVVLTLCFFWLDILTHTLPTLGVPAYLFFGSPTATSSAEAYLGAVWLGVPGWLFQVSAIGLSITLLVFTSIRWTWLVQIDKLNPVVNDAL